MMRGIVPKDTQILLLTASDWDMIEKDALCHGIDGFLAKPFFVTALKEKLFEIFRGEKEPDKKSREKAECADFSGLRFLVAEDNEINAEILMELLGAEGVNCEVMDNGKLALERFCESREGEFDVILMDVQMPVMNGYDATRAIRALPRKDASKIPIIAMTANAFAEDVKDALNAGMNAHVPKPIDMDVVKETISYYLNERNRK